MINSQIELKNKDCEIKHSERSDQSFLDD